MKKFSFEEFLEKHALDFFIIFLVILNVLPILAPILAHLGFTQVSSWIYEIYSYFCHQRSWRSIHIFDYQFAWCARDTFIYFSLLISLVITKYTNVKPLKWYLLIIFCIPIALDGGIQTVAEILTSGRNVFQFYESNNFMRMLTGSLFGLAVGFWMWPMLRNTLNSDKVNISRLTKYKWMEKPYLWVIVLLILNVFIYVSLIQIWIATSTKYFPGNRLDSLPKTQKNASDRCKRATDSTNPKSIPLLGCE